MTRDPEAIRQFVSEVGHSVVKPLYGAKGRNVFMIEDEGEANLAQMTEAVLQDGYAIVQEFVEGGENGDARIFLLEGKILERGGKLAAFRRVPTGNDPRANISAGGVFVHTVDPPPLKTVVRVEMELPGGGPPVPARGLVVHRVTREDAEQRGTLPGIGVQFVDADDLFRARIDTAIEQILGDEKP